jgi:hypothetical protein
MYLAKNIYVIIFCFHCVIFLLFFVLALFVCFLFCFVVHYFYIPSKKLAGGFNGIGDVSTSLFNMHGLRNLIVEIKLFEKNSY